MGAELKREDIITDEALEAPLILARNLEEAYMVIQKIAKESKTIPLPTDGMGKQREETTKLTLEQKELAKVTKQIAAITARNNAEYLKEAKALEQVKKALKDKSTLGEKDAKTISATNASVKELNAALQKNKQAYEQLTSAEARSSKEGTELLKVIQSQDKELKHLKETMGEHQLNVGNYGNALKNLKVQLGAAKDEMAGIAATLGTNSPEFKEAADKAGALKNEIGDLTGAIDAVSGSKLENVGSSFGLMGAKLKALDFKGASAAAKQFGGSIKQMSFKGVTEGAGAFGKQMVKLGVQLLLNPIFLVATAVIGIGAALYKLKDNIPALTKAFDLMGEAIGWVVQQGKDFLDFMGLTRFAADEKAQAVIDGAQKEIDAIQESYDRKIKIAEAEGKDTLALEVEKNNAIIAEAKKGSDNILAQRAIYGKDVREADTELYDDLIKIQKDAQAEIEALNAGHTREEIEKAKEAAEKRKKQREKEEAERKAAAEKERQAQFALDKFLLEQEEKKLSAIAGNSQKEIDARVEASEELESVRKQLAEVEFNNAMATAGDSVAGQVLAMRQLEAALTEIKQQGINERDAIAKDAIAREKERAEKAVEEGKAAAAKAYDAAKERLDAEAQLIKQAAIDGVISKAQAEKQLAELQKSMSDEYIQLMIDEAQKVLEITDLTTEQRAEQEKKLAQLQKDLQDSVYDQVTDTRDKTLEGIEKFLEKVQAEFSKWSGALLELSAANTERKLAKIDEESEAEEEHLAQQLEAEDTLLQRQLLTQDLTDQQKKDIEEQSEARKAALEKASELRQIEYEKRRRQLIRKQAMYEKAVALTQAIIAGALAVVKALPIIPLAIAAGVFAAIQIAAIAMRPIPAAEHGIHGHKGGLIVAGERGQELVKMPGGRLALTDAVAKVYDFPRGTDIIPHDETMRMLASEGLRVSSAKGQEVEGYGRLEAKLDKINNTIKNKREVNVTGQITGYNDGGTRARYIEFLRNKPK